MIAQFIWLAVSYALVFAVGLSLIEAGAVLWGYAVCVVIPVVRVACRFRTGGGYRFIGSSSIAGNAFDRSRKVTRAAHPILFRIVFVIELAVIVAFVLHSTLR